jgi:outer membrane protein assembly factor BamB
MRPIAKHLVCTGARTLVLLTAIAAGCDHPDDEDIDRACDELASGHTCTWIGIKGEQGWNGDGEHRLRTNVNQPVDMIFLDDGTPWFTDFNNYEVRRVNADDTIETMVGATDPAFPGDGPFDGIKPEGAAGTDWLLNHPTNLILAADGTIILDAWHNHKLLTIDPDTGFVKVLCGGGAGFAGDGMPAGPGTLFKQLVDVTRDDAGNLYVVDQQNGRVRMIGVDGIVSTIAGDGMPGYAGDGGPALEAEFSWARGSNPNPSGGIVHFAGKLYISDTEHHVIRVLDLAGGTIDAFAGTGEPGDGGDGGPALQAKLHAPRDLEIGPDGELYFADTDNGRVRAIALDTGIIRTVVGTGKLGLDEDEGLPATETKLSRPFGIAFDGDGNLYVMDSLNFRIVKVAK